MMPIVEASSQRTFRLMEDLAETNSLKRNATGQHLAKALADPLYGGNSLAFEQAMPQFEMKPAIAASGGSAEPNSRQIYVIYAANVKCKERDRKRRYLHKSAGPTMQLDLSIRAYRSNLQGTIAEGDGACSGGLKIARYPTPPLRT